MNTSPSSRPAAEAPAARPAAPDAPAAPAPPSPLSRTDRSRKGFLFYFSWLTDMRELPEQERNNIVLALVEYAARGTLPRDFNPYAKALFNAYRNVIDYDIERFAAAETPAARRSQQTRRPAAVAACHSQQSADAQHTAQVFAPRSAAALPSAECQHTTSSPARALKNNNTSNNMLSSSLPSSPPGEASAASKPKVDGTLEPGAGLGAGVGGRGVEGGDSCAGGVVSCVAGGASCVVGGASGAGVPMAGGSGGGGSVPTMAELEAFWAAKGFGSSARDFFDYYERRGWFNKSGVKISRWKAAALQWEQYFRSVVQPLREREAAADEALRLQRRNLEAVARSREEERARREADYERARARAVSPAEGRRLYEQALALHEGNHERALAWLKTHPRGADGAP